jgi:alkylhydroperoxidase family enzyme
MPARVESATPPFGEDISRPLYKVMKGQLPLRLFTTLARDARLFQKFFAGGLLDKGHLSMRQREIVIHRTTALCKSEYEWGVHVTAYSRLAGLTPEQVRATVTALANEAIWSAEDQVLLRLCDSLHAHTDIDDGLWDALRKYFSEEAIIELLMLAGFYRTVSYLTNGLRLPLEESGARFPA